MKAARPTAVLCTALFLLAASATQTYAQAQYPTQPIKIVCAFPAGGGTDLTSRLLGEQLQKILGQQVVIENRTGPSGMIGTGFLANPALGGGPGGGCGEASDLAAAKCLLVVYSPHRHQRVICGHPDVPLPADHAASRGGVLDQTIRGFVGGGSGVGV